MLKNYNYYIKEQEKIFEEINKIASKTYLLLSSTILFSAITSIISIKLNSNIINPFLYIIIIFGLLYLIENSKKNSIKLSLVFILTGFIGYYTGPILKIYLSTPNGQKIISLALTITGINFLLLSTYVIINKKNLDFLKGIILTIITVTIMLTILNIFLKIKIIHIIISGLIILLSSAIILNTTTEILNGKETNYIDATVTLYLQIYNIFLSLLSLLNIFSSKED